MAENRVSNTQLGELLDFLETNQAVARGVGMGSRSKENIEREWNNLAAKLNAHGGGCSKTGIRWKRYWADLKHKVKSRAAERRRDARGTGGGPSNFDDLSETDKKVLAIIGEPAVFGDQEHQVPAFPTTTSMNATAVSEGEIINLDESFCMTTRQIQEEMMLPHLASPSTRGNTSRIEALEIPPSSRNNQHGLPPQPTGYYESPVRRPHRLPRRSRTTRLQTQASNVSTEWVVDLERRRVAAEEKHAAAALVIANALTSFVEISRIHVESSRMFMVTLHELLDLLKSKHNN